MPRPLPLSALAAVLFTLPAAAQAPPQTRDDSLAVPYRTAQSNRQRFGSRHPAT